MKLTVGNILYCRTGLYSHLVAVGFIGYYTVMAFWDYFHKP
jgi:hypothetical protein